MRIITHKTILRYAELHADAQLALDEWYIKTERSRFIGTHAEYDKIKDCSLV